MTWNLTADGVRNLLVADFWNHSCAGHCLLNGLWDPLLAAYRLRRTLNANHLCAARVAWINNTLLNNWAWDALGFCNPFAAAYINCVTFSYRLADGVANVFVAGFCFCLVGCAANVLVASLVNRLANVVAHRSVASLVHRLANRVAALTIACLVARLANFACHVAVAGFVHGLADVVSAGFVACRVDRLANRVALITVAGFMDVLCAGDRD